MKRNTEKKMEQDKDKTFDKATSSVTVALLPGFFEKSLQFMLISKNEPEVCGKNTKKKGIIINKIKILRYKIPKK